MTDIQMVAERAGKAAYQTYHWAMGTTGSVPTWEGLSTHEQQAWRAAVYAANRAR